MEAMQNEMRPLVELTGAREAPIQDQVSQEEPRRSRSPLREEQRVEGAEGGEIEPSQAFPMRDELQQVTLESNRGQGQSQSQGRGQGAGRRSLRGRRRRGRGRGNDRATAINEGAVGTSQDQRGAEQRNEGGVDRATNSSSTTRGRGNRARGRRGQGRRVGAENGGRGRGDVRG